MAGIYKQTRSLAVSHPYRTVWTDKYYGTKTVYAGVVGFPGQQTTISYRSQGREEDRVADVSPSLFSFPTGDTGHPFDTVKQTCKAPTSRIVKGEVYDRHLLSGFAPVLVRSNSNGDAMSEFPVVASLSKSESNRMGAKFILATTPTSSQANLLLTIAELVREGLPAIPAFSLRQGSALKNLGGESLNYQFGIAPLISDLQKIAKAVLTAPEILEQFRKDSGKLITRRRVIEHDPINSVTNVDMYPNGPIAGSTLSAAFFGSSGWNARVERQVRVETTTRFVGAYQYELDIGDDAISRLKSFEAQANQLLGTRITPELLWNLTPWSWLSDWFANIGDILGNAGNFAADGLVMKYGYLMRHTVATQYNTLVTRPDSPTPSTRLVTRYRTERKERVQATPFGFGTDVGSLSEYQVGIAASLAAANTPQLERPRRSPRR